MIWLLYLVANLDVVCYGVLHCWQYTITTTQHTNTDGQIVSL